MAPTKAAIERTVVDAANIFEKDDTLRMLIVHVAGHGVQHTGCPYFLPSDAKDHDVESHLNLNNLFGRLGLVKKPVLYIFDFCRTEGGKGTTTSASVTNTKVAGWSFYTAPPDTAAPDGRRGTTSPATKALLEGLFGPEGRRRPLYEVLSDIAGDLEPRPQFLQSYDNGSKPKQYYLFQNARRRGSATPSTMLSRSDGGRGASRARLLEKKVSVLDSMMKNAISLKEYGFAKEKKSELEAVKRRIDQIKALETKLKESEAALDLVRWQLLPWGGLHALPDV